MLVYFVRSHAYMNVHVYTLCFNCFLQPVDHQGNLIPDPEADYYLFDRVINVSTTNAVPFGLRGTVMGIYGGKLPTMDYSYIFKDCVLHGLLWEY